MHSLVPVALFTSAEKTQSKSKFRRFAIVLLAFLGKGTYCCWYFSRAAFYLFVVARVGAGFPQFCEGCISFACVDQLHSEQIFHYIHVCEVISAYIVYF